MENMGKKDTTNRVTLGGNSFADSCPRELASPKRLLALKTSFLGFERVVRTGDRGFFSPKLPPKLVLGFVYAMTQSHKLIKSI